MAGYAWLADAENQDAAYRLAHAALSQMAPDELPLLDGVFDNYVALAQSGEVQPGREGAYGFAGSEALMAALLTDLAINLLNALLIAAGARAFKDMVVYWRERRKSPPPPKSADPIGAAVLEGVARLYWLSAQERQKVAQCLLETMEQFLQTE